MARYTMRTIDLQLQAEALAGELAAVLEARRPSNGVAIAAILRILVWTLEDLELLEVETFAALVQQLRDLERLTRAWLELEQCDRQRH